MPRLRAASIDEIRPLRHAVLRKGQDFSTTIYEEDLRADARHFAACSDDDTIAAIASVYAESREEGATHAWRLRGMASAERVRGKGFGSAVLRFTIEQARKEGICEIWCNAREVAYAFYQSHDFQIIGDTFDLPGIGVHSVMVLKLA